jgi:hypothetical protein
VDYADQSSTSYTMEQETFLKMWFQVFVFPNHIYKIRKKEISLNDQFYIPIKQLSNIMKAGMKTPKYK